MKKSIAVIVLALFAFAVVVLVLRRPAQVKPEERVALSAQPAIVTEPAQAAPGPAKSLQPPAVQAVRGPMPTDTDTLSKFLEAHNSLTANLPRGTDAVAYSISASRGVCLAIDALGFDPDKTLLYWLSPAFQQDVAKGNPAEAVSISRTMANYLAVALGDGVSDAEFAEIIIPFSAELQAEAKRRRAGR